MPELNKQEQAIADKIQKTLETKNESANIDVDSIAKAVSELNAKSESDNQKAIDDAVAKALDEQKKNHNPFANVQNVQVKNENIHPYGSLAIATLRAAKAHKSVEQFISERLQQNPTSQADKAMALTLAKSYHNSGNREGLETLKSLGVDSITNGAGFSDASADGEFIRQLRARSVVRTANPRIKRLINGRLNLNRGASNATASWIDAGATITESQPSYEQITLLGKKLATLVGIDNEALRFDLHGMASEVEADIIDAIALAEDIAFLTGVGSTGQPKGLKNWVVSGNSFTRTASADADKAGKDLRKLKSKLVAGNVRMVSPAMFMHPSVKNALEGQVDGNGVLKIYARTLQESNQILGATVYETTQLDTTDIIMADMDEVVIGEGYDLIVESDTSVGFKSDQTFIRAVKSSDLQMRHAEGVSAISSVDWDTVLL